MRFGEPETAFYRIRSHTLAARLCIRIRSKRSPTTKFGIQTSTTHQAPRPKHHAPVQPEPLESLFKGLLAKLGLPAPSVNLSLDERWAL